MKHIFISNDTTQLCNELGSLLKNQVNSPFEPDRFVVPHAGMEAWLKINLSEKNGVFSNFIFQGLDDILSDLWTLTGGKGHIASRLHLKFKLFELLNQDEFLSAFPQVAGYYKDDEIRRLQLSEKLADLFDQYQVYRPEFIEKWEKPGADRNDFTEQERWQNHLWGELVSDRNLIYKTHILEHVLINIGRGDVMKRVQTAYPRLIFFAQSHYPDFFRKLIEELDAIIPVYLFVLMPCKIGEQYHHPLLKAWGLQAKEMNDWLFSNGIEKIIIEPIEKDDTLLHAIQSQIIQDTNPKDVCFASSMIQDGSLQVNACYTRVREVECLYDYLIDRFDNDKDLLPDEVMVVAPDMELYAPYIEGVFSDAPKKIPFHIAGVSVPNERAILPTLRDILDFGMDDFTSEKVMELLEKRRIRDFFEIQDTEYLRGQIKKANIRFGWDNNVEDESIYVGWKYNLDRFILGYAMLTEEEFEVQSGITAYPFQDAESQSSYDLFKLREFATVLYNHIVERTRERTIAEWVEFLFKEVLDKMVLTNYSDKEELADLHKRVSSLLRITNPYNDKISYIVFYETIHSLLFTEMRTTPFRVGPVCFTSLSTARAIPKKVIVILGMNQKDFPRRDLFLGFDLLGLGYKTWDRRKRENDKSLFLDLLMNARNAFYISYLGKDIKDNTELPASIMIDQLLDFIDSTEMKPSVDTDPILMFHPLHGFSSKYQKENNRLYTYLYGNNQSKKFDNLDKEEKDIYTVDIETLVKFYDSPIEWYYKNVLGIYFENNDLTLSEQELFDLEGLQEWNLKKEFINNSVDNSECENQRLKLSKSGQLALAHLGINQEAAILKKIRALKEKHKMLTKGIEQKSISIDIDFNIDLERKMQYKVRLIGVINDIYDTHYYPIFISDLTKQKYKTRFLIRHLALLAHNDLITDSYAIGIDNKGILKELELGKIEDAKSKLRSLLGIYLKGNERLLLYHPRDKENKINDLPTLEKELKTQFTPSEYKNPSTYGMHILEEGVSITDTDLKLRNQIVELLE